MKIAFVYDAIYPYRVGGVEKRIAEISRRLARRGHEVHIFGLSSWEENIGFSKHSVHYHGVGKTCPFYTEGRRSIREAFYFAIKIFLPLYRQSFDIIDCQNFPYLHCFPVALVAKLKKDRLVITWHEVWGTYWYEYIGRFGFFGRLIEKTASHLPGTTVAVSKKTRSDLFDLNRRVKIEIIPNGIDFFRIERVNPSKTVSDIIFSGRLVREKNIDSLIWALVFVKKVLPEVQCVIIGDGPEKTRLSTLAQDCGVSENIRFMGFVSDHDEVIALMKSSKVFGSPSIREGFGIAPLEAMACGLPVVTSDGPKNAVRELIHEKTGLVSPLSPDTFAESIIECIQKRDEMRNECIKFAAACDWDVIAEKIESYYAYISGIKGSVLNTP